MKNSRQYPRRWFAAFTIIELLVVIAIIGILAAMLLPALLSAKVKAQVNAARSEMSLIANAVNAYHSEYSRFPVSSATMSVATATQSDYTFGGSSLAGVLGPGPWTAPNSEVISIVMDLTDFPSVNTNHVKNPQRIKFLNASMVNGTSSGVGSDLVYRDPWGNPYIISLDLNYDEKCRDEFFRRTAVSGGGLNGLVNPTGAADAWEYNGGVMVWSLGPDKKASRLQPADKGDNKDNVLSWKQ